jgi:hypothetical protein
MELKMCLEVCRRYKSDPFHKNIWFVKRWDKNADNGKGGHGALVYTAQVGIWGMMQFAARDHGDYGTLSRPEYGPEETYDIEGHKIRAPKWCIVKAFKKGLTEPSIGEVFFNEYCPKKWANAEPFWAKYPHRMIAKCAKAQAIREAYPSLGGLMIAEEMDRTADEYTASGRQIVQDVPYNGSRSQAQAVVQEKLARATRGESIDLETSQIASNSEPDHPKGAVEVDHTNETYPIVRGDIGDILQQVKEACPSATWGKDSWWHIKAGEVESLRVLCAKLGYELREVMPKSNKGGGAKSQTTADNNTQSHKGGGSSAKSSSSPVLISGTIEQANPQQDKRPRMSLLMKVNGKAQWMTAWDMKLWPHLTQAPKGTQAEVWTETRNTGGKVYVNVVGLKRVGRQEFDADGKTPILQNASREAGGKTLF